jgi:hypothetical protein
MRKTLLVQGISVEMPYRIPKDVGRAAICNKNANGETYLPC